MHPLPGRSTGKAPPRYASARREPPALWTILACSPPYPPSERHRRTPGLILPLLVGLSHFACGLLVLCLLLICARSARAGGGSRVGASRSRSDAAGALDAAAGSRTIASREGRLTRGRLGCMPVAYRPSGHLPGWDGAGAPGGASPRPEPGAGSAGPGAAQRRRLIRRHKDYSAGNELRIEGPTRDPALLAPAPARRDPLGTSTSSPPPGTATFLPRVMP